MRVISVWNLKGGCGKTTLALNLAGSWHTEGKHVLLVDLDPQGSSMWVANRGQLQFPVVPALPQRRPDVDVMVIDHAPGTDTVPPAPVVIIPIRPSALDYAAAQQIMVRLRDKKVIQVINAVDYRRQEEALVARELLNRGALVVRDRSAYSRLMGQGLTVFHADTNLYGVREARAEIEEVKRRIEGEDTGLAQ